MRTLLITVGVGLLGCIGYLLVDNITGDSQSNANAAKPIEPTGSPATNKDAQEVFQRAFWKRPTPSDEILNAERREWADENGVTRWQWFLEVSPSSELRQHLFTRNAFSLIQRTELISAPKDRPTWFPQNSSGLETHSSRGQEMVLFYDQEAGRIFATGHGGGFVRATAAPNRPAKAQTTVSTGRLPNTSPPDPRQQ